MRYGFLFLLIASAARADDLLERLVRQDTHGEAMRELMTSNNPAAYVGPLSQVIRNDPSEFVRERAVNALLHTRGGTAPFEVLKFASQDPKKRVRCAAAQALGALATMNKDAKIGGRPAGEAVASVLLPMADADGANTRACALRWMHGLPSRLVVDALVKGLDDESHFVREAAGHALGGIVPPGAKAVPKLEALVADVNEKDDVRNAAAGGLREIYASLKKRQAGAKPYGSTKPQACEEYGDGVFWHVQHGLQKRNCITSCQDTFNNSHDAKRVRSYECRYDGVRVWLGTR